MALWSLIPAAASFAVTALNKPKKIKYNDKYLKNYVASLRGKKISGDVRQLALEAESKVIGKQTGRAMRKIEATSADPGQKADAIVNLYTKQNEALGGASDRASRLQEERNAQIDQRMSGAEEYIAKVRDQIRMQNEMNQDQYKQNLIGSGANLLATGAATLGQQAYNKSQALKQGYETAKAEGLIPATDTFEAYKASAEGGAYTDPALYNKSLQTGQIKQQTQAFSQVIGEFAKTGQLPEGFDPSTLSNPQQLILAQIQASETTYNRKQLAGMIDKFQERGIVWTPNEGEDMNVTAYRLEEQGKIDIANELGFPYSDKDEVYQINFQKKMNEASAPVSSAMSIFFGNEPIDTKITNLTQSMNSVKDEGDKTKIFNMLTSLSKQKADLIASGMMTPAQQKAFDNANSQILITSQKLDEAIVPITEENKGTGINRNNEIRLIQEKLDSQQPVSRNEYEAMVLSLKKASNNVPTVNEYEYYSSEAGKVVTDPMGKAKADAERRNWWSARAKEIAEYLAATGRFINEGQPDLSNPLGLQ